MLQWQPVLGSKLAKSDYSPLFVALAFRNRLQYLVLLWPPNFYRHRGGWLPANQHRHRGVLQWSRRSFWVLFSENCPSLMQSRDSPLNAAPFDPAWTASRVRVGDTDRPTPHVPIRFPTCKQQDCQDSRDSLGTELSKTVTTVLLSALPTVACSEQSAHSRTAVMIYCKFLSL